MFGIWYFEMWKYRSCENLILVKITEYAVN